ncbi:unnamed protein product [Cuscuta epithymum]|uniref:Peptidase C1A papain C-terminal domain-containing protein n=1 Tax=Cuscuta epithymum TaxID=186058 RepID=A0AAV0EFH9_9ASTE|nr:unnamed protein product [Cuscuta epithymum]
MECRRRINNETFSYRNTTNYLSQAKDQGLYPTCYLHALLSLLECKLRMKQACLVKRRAIGNLSVEHVLDGLKKEEIMDGAHPLYSKRVETFLKDHGVAFEKNYCKGKKGTANCYKIKRFIKFETGLKKSKVKLVTAVGPKVMRRDSTSSRSYIEKLKKELRTNGPLIVSFKLRTGFTELSKNSFLTAEAPYTQVPVPKEGKDEDVSYKNEWHACVLVGFQFINGVDCFEILNSWGTSWSDKGYGFIMASDVERAYSWEALEKLSS